MDVDYVEPSSSRYKLELESGNSRAELLITQRYLDTLLRVTNDLLIPIAHQVLEFHRLPIPTSMDIIVPESEYFLAHAVIDGKPYRPVECQLYLRFYQGGAPHLVLLHPETGAEALFELLFPA